MCADLYSPNLRASAGAIQGLMPAAGRLLMHEDHWFRMAIVGGGRHQFGYVDSDPSAPGGSIQDTAYAPNPFILPDSNLPYRDIFGGGGSYGGGFAGQPGAQLPPNVAAPRPNPEMGGGRVAVPNNPPANRGNVGFPPWRRARGPGGGGGRGGSLTPHDLGSRWHSDVQIDLHGAVQNMSILRLDGSWAAYPPGNDGDILTVNGGIVEWGAFSPDNDDKVGMGAKLFRFYYKGTDTVLFVLDSSVDYRDRLFRISTAYKQQVTVATFMGSRVEGGANELPTAWDGAGVANGASMPMWGAVIDSTGGDLLATIWVDDGTSVVTQGASAAAGNLMCKFTNAGGDSNEACLVAAVDYYSQLVAGDFTTYGNGA